jgi:transitional endoplasmic reticulum ATPase
MDQAQIDKMAATIAELKENADKAEAAKIRKVDVFEVVRHGEKIVVPESVPLATAAKSLLQKAQEEEKVIQFHEDIETFIWDGAYAMTKAMEKLFGYSIATPIPGFFGDTPPQMMAVHIDHDKTVSIPWGRFKLPGMEGYVQTSYTKKHGRFYFSLMGEIQKKNEPYIKALANLTREIIKAASIYRGKAIQIRFNDDNGNALTLPEPKFLDLSETKNSKLVFSDEVRLAIEHNLFVPIEHSAECRQHKIPLKRGVLLAGKYGTGKTLTGFHTAAKCVANGWTYIHCQRADELPECLRFARQYTPSVVFCEDIDRVVEGERTVEMDDILNTLDGVDGKGMEVITVLTTNHLEDINQAMLRPGRIDALINVLPPDEKAVQSLLHLYGRGLIDVNADLSSVGNELKGEIPAVIQESVEKAKLAAISLRKNPNDPLKLTPQALLEAAVGMRAQREALREQKDEDEDLLHAEAFGKAIGDPIAAALEAYLMPNGLKYQAPTVNGKV